MKNIFALLYITLSISIFGQNTRSETARPSVPSSQTMKAGAFIDVNSAAYPQSNFAITQLITNVLINGGSNCTANVSNVTVSPNLLASNQDRSWGYFNKGTTSFPFNDGIILTTGYARRAGNAFIGNTLSDVLGTGGDLDLAAAIGVNNNRLADATTIEFDFVPVTNQISFNYLFASEEYTGTFPCTYTDGFALLIKKVGDPAYTNLAILPNGAGPVSTTNIHNANGSCGAVNAQYFAGNNTASIETNFNGRTIPLQASATVIPGQTYHFKMVLADASGPGSSFSDDSFDSGVFLQAGSFNIGVQLNDGSGNALPANVSICAGTSQMISANVTTPGATYQWLLNSTAIAGATNPTYTASVAGIYTIEVLIPGSTCPGTAQITLNVLPNPVVQNATLTLCSPATTAAFNLTTAQPNISTTSGVTFTYYTNQADALANNGNFIANPANFTSGNATIYVVVKNGNCRSVAELQLTISATPATPTITTSSNILCSGGSVTLTSSATTGNTWSTGATTPSITVSTTGTYTLTVANGSCVSAAASTTITAQTDPNVQISGTLVFCQGGNSILTATATGTGNTFSWSNGSTTATTTVSTSGTYTVTVTTPSGCTFTKSAVVQVDTPPSVQNATLVECSTGSSALFNLTTAQTSITTSTTSTFSYYANQADALAGNANTIGTPTSFTSGNATVYVVIKTGTCSQVVQLMLSVTQTVVPTITASSAVICGNATVTLTSNFATGNTWSTGATTQSITVSTAGTYTLTQTGTNCTSTPASIVITKNDDPNVQITGNLAFCAGTSTTLTANATGTGNTFIWSNGSTTATTNITTAGTYTVTVTTSGGCVFTKNAIVTVNPLPTTANSTLSLCSLTTTADFDLTSAQNAISTSSGISFAYYTSLADANAGTANFIVNPAVYNSPTATIYVRVSNANCFKVANLQLTVVLTPTPLISQSAPAICAGTPVTLTSNYATGNVWSTGATTQSITVSAAGTYSLVVSNGNCPSSSVSVTIVANADPNVQISGVLSYCQGSSTTLTATSTGQGNTYLWSTGSTNNTITVNTAGIYTVTVTTPAGCTFQRSVTVTQEPIITLNIAQPSQINCTTPTVTLNATASIFQAGSTILWTTTGGGTIASGANTLSPVVSTGGNYTLTITNTTGLLCSQQATVTVIQSTTPPTITVTAPKTTICAGEGLVLTFSGAQTYTVNGSPNTGSTLNITPNTTTTYTITGVGANGCQGNTTTITINVVPAIVSTIADIQFCKGLSGVLDAGVGPNYSYLWNTGATTQTITVNTEGVYNVTINNGTCTKIFSATVSYTPVPVISEVTYINTTLSINIQQPIPANLEYSINGGIDWQASNIFTNVVPNLNYSILVRVKGNLCFSTTEYYAFFVQNVITPNADGINDFIDFTGVSQYKEFKAIIFDRYGKEIFRATPKNPIWNGNYIKLNLPTASYWYQVSWLDPISNKPILRNGWILLKNRD
ncbi:choice-of-anchor L domain-containing protein [Frigoriflavimonas asaccharolytica]|uniref:Gliding motility-associated-like protein n=1 Tax=Frigoriflavimonas asaccharolytica TaxID=2735899 RepID=A0A8J8K9Q0_9FLAO|nr:choice-of-anchor L domain-containing protein [Frigoriflavimonas asaccharolytica]NRS94023.1 gliding motility-associated-like protein [Frigoriflavimonas asaccharolytica]